MLSFDHSARLGLVMVGRVLSKIPDFVTTNTAGVRYVSTKVSRGFTLTFLKPRFHRWSLAWWQLCHPAATSPPSPAPPDVKVSPYTCAVNVLLWFAGNVKLGILLWWLRWKLQACKIKHHRKKFHNFSTYDNWSTYYCVNKLPEKEKKFPLKANICHFSWLMDSTNQSEPIFCRWTN